MKYWSFLPLFFFRFFPSSGMYVKIKWLKSEEKMGCFGGRLASGLKNSRRCLWEPGFPNFKNVPTPMTSSECKLRTLCLTRALESQNLPSPPVFFSRITQKRRRQIWSTCPQIINTSCVQILTSMVKRSGHQVRSNRGQMCTPGPASNFKIVRGHSFGPNVLKLSVWDIGMDTYIMYFSDFSF